MEKSKKTDLRCTPLQSLARCGVTGGRTSGRLIDVQNRKKLLDKASNPYFRAEVLPKCTVLRIAKR